MCMAQRLVPSAAARTPGGEGTAGIKAAISTHCSTRRAAAATTCTLSSARSARTAPRRQARPPRQQAPQMLPARTRSSARSPCETVWDPGLISAQHGAV